MSVRIIRGELTVTGPYKDHGGSEPSARYDYMRFVESGRQVYLQDVVVPAYIDSFIRAGVRAVFYLVELRYPTLFFCRKSVWMMYGVEMDGQVHEAVSKVARRVSGGNLWEAVQYALVGLVTLPLAGVGILLLILAARTLAVTLPVVKMRAALADGGGV